MQTGALSRISTATPVASPASPVRPVQTPASDPQTPVVPASESPAATAEATPAVATYRDTPLDSPNAVSFGSMPAVPEPAAPAPASGQELATRTADALRQRADSPQFREMLQQVYPNAQPERIDNLIQQIRSGELPLPSVELVAPDVLNGNLGAYSDTGRIFINQDLLSRPAELDMVMMQEMGHHIDKLLGGGDSPGDEGQALSLAMAKGGVPLDQEELALTRNRPDAGTITVNGETLQVEHAGPLIPLALWTLKAAASTTVDAVIGSAIGAITGVPPGWFDTAIDFGINFVTPPGVNQTRKVGNLVEAVDDVADTLRSLRGVPGADRLLGNITASKDEVLAAIETAVTSGDVQPVKTAMKQLIGHIREAQIATRLKANGAAVERTNLTFRRGRDDYVEIDVISNQNGQRYFDQVKSGDAVNFGPRSNSWSKFTRQVDRSLEMAQEGNAKVRYYVDNISQEARDYLTQRGVEIIENGRFLAD